MAMNMPAHGAETIQVLRRLRRCADINIIEMPRLCKKE
jgi:hypothetical protein